jgi:hypothetical protein
MGYNLPIGFLPIFVAKSAAREVSFARDNKNTEPEETTDGEEMKQLVVQ